MASVEHAAQGALPLVTLVTPTYNQAEYLAETIESVLAQDYPNIEYIVIDDGSTDGTRKILERYAGRIRWESQSNRGQAATLNRGWAMGSGEIIGYLSSDDLIKSNAVAEAVGCLLKHPETALVYPDFELIDASGRHIRHVEAPDYSYFDLAVNLVCQPGPGAFFWKKHFEHLGGWNPSFRQTPDFEYWLRLSEQGVFRRIPCTLSSSRVHEGSQSFTVTSVRRAMEPVLIVDDYYGARSDAASVAWRNQARARARVKAARLLFRAGAPAKGFSQLGGAVCLAPKLLLTAGFWRLLLSAAAGRLYYRLWFDT